MTEPLGNVLAKDLNEIYTGMRDDLFRFILSKVKSADDAEDIVQHLYIQLIALTDEKLRSIENVRSYIFGIANLLALNHLRRQSKMNLRHVSEDVVEFERVDDVEDPERILDSRQTMDVLRVAIDDMPAKRRQVFLYYRFGNLSVQQISEELEMSVSAVEKHIVRALLFCRERMKEAGL